MLKCKGFTLIEIITVMFIIGIITAIAIPNYTSMAEQGMAQAAKNNLMVIGNAQKNYFLNQGTYCSTCETLSSINTTLSLNISDNNYSYACILLPAPEGFQCTSLRTVSGIHSPSSVGITYNPNPPTFYCLGNQTSYCPSGTIAN